MIRIAICDDEALLLNEIEMTVRNYMQTLPKQVEIDPYTDGYSLLDQMEKTPYDLALLDVEMPQLNGLKLAKEINRLSPNTCVILLTLHDKYAVKGYEINIYRYAKKDDVPTLLNYLRDAITYIEKSSSQWLVVQTGQSIVKVHFHDIYSICKDGKYSIFSTRHHGELRERKSLNEIYEELDKNEFVFAERSIIVNLNNIVQITNDKVVLDNQTTLPVSRVKRKILKNRWNLFMADKL